MIFCHKSRDLPLLFLVMIPFHDTSWAEKARDPGALVYTAHKDLERRALRLMLLKTLHLIPFYLRVCFCVYCLDACVVDCKEWVAKSTSVVQGLLLKLQVRVKERQPCVIVFDDLDLLVSSDSNVFVLILIVEIEWWK
jgi:hypothetical protein